MYRGYVKFWRKIDDNPIAVKPAYLSVWLYILRFANHKNKEIIWNNKKTMINKGSFITSANKISKGTGVPRGTVERILKYLENEVMIEEQTTKKFRLISVINYKNYQPDEEVNEEQMRNKRGTSEEQVDTTNNDKELIIINKNECGDKSPAQIARKFFEKWEKGDTHCWEGLSDKWWKICYETTNEQRDAFLDEVTKFVSYWTEPNKSGTKVRWEQQKTFEINRRLATWMNNYKQFNQTKKGGITKV